MKGGKSLKVIKKIIGLSWSLDKKHFIFLLVLSLLNVLIPILSMLNTQYIVNGIQLGISFNSLGFLVPLVCLMLINISAELISSAMNYSSLRYKDILDFKFSQLILTKVNKQSLSRFEDPKFYDLLQRAEQAGGVYPNNIMNNIISLIVQTISSIGYILILISWKWWTILIILIFPLLSSFQVSRISSDEYKLLYNRTTYERKSWYFAHLLNKDINVKETRLFSLEKFFLGKFEKIREKFIRENRIMYRRRSIYTFFIQFISILSSMLILCVLFFEASLGEILIGSLMTYINSISSVKSNFGSIIATLFKLHQNSLYANNIVELLGYEDDNLTINNQSNKVIIDEIECIEIKDLSFKYKTSGKYALKNINLKFKKGNNYILVGRNGSGKTTLIKLLLGFYDSYTGSILINGKELKTIDKVSYRKCLSAIFQDHTNFQFIVEDVISLSNTEVKNDFLVKESARDANADIFIKKLPNNYKQQVGNWFANGTQLSGGEWQKLSIARAFYKKDASLIILDEPSSALDAISENRIYENFNKLSNNKIGIFITHRLRNFDFQGHIIVMDKAEVIETGKQEDLLNNEEGMFRKMYTVQNTIRSGSV
ncbi:ABC transporter ATP-binding protein [Bacillus paranthracis]|uniref:ABC transporter ATP-binding protein n=2 Tax=Bacillus paranthracis TaxID=2026186 RepID=UPI0015C4EAD1|nr:ABC transporter ATP-binding protein [Bacillus paranthracis]MED0785546.1 ABC transporter ATP-binding protein [Bacillus paranthracis]MED0809162.1 ABC transporter ATP-binding protein [Bacillus paranthracis]MED0817213.1 ABC transporter ATP-binding protein [Bacillus paranthracis]MED1159701.1 ABC transporter ATP-binding protein [Bacillus paranthracis]MED1181643.1 ABC transporter ATP-binding protein [Bacillus paranthracis]